MPFKIIDEQLVNSVAQTAQNSALKRSLYVMHESNDDKVHRLVSVIEPGSYLRPHRHLDPNKIEIFMILKGKLAVVEFAEDGRPSGHVILEAGKSPWGVEVPPASWHMSIALEPDTTVFTIVEGPWDPKTHKKFPTWAPLADDTQAVEAFVGKVRQELMLY